MDEFPNNYILSHGSVLQFAKQYCSDYSAGKTVFRKFTSISKSINELNRVFMLQELQSGKVLLRLAHLYEVLIQLLFFDLQSLELKIRAPSFISN